jgi:hypothetical protein
MPRRRRKPKKKGPEHDDTAPARLPSAAVAEVNVATRRRSPRYSNDEPTATAATAAAAAAADSDAELRITPIAATASTNDSVACHTRHFDQRKPSMATPRARKKRRQDEVQMMTDAAADAIPIEPVLTPSTSSRYKRKRRPRDTSDQAKNKLKSLKDMQHVPCPVPGCDHPGFTFAYNRWKKNQLEKYQKNIFLPMLPDGCSIAWDETDRWTLLKSDIKYDNFLRGVINHFCFMIDDRKCDLHKLHCPQVIKDRAQNALDRCKDPSTSTHRYRELWEALDLKPSPPPPS